jgi:hypothetical protein
MVDGQSHGLDGESLGLADGLPDVCYAVASLVAIEVGRLAVADQQKQSFARVRAQQQLGGMPQVRASTSARIRSSTALGSASA